MKHAECWTFGTSLGCTRSPRSGWPNVIASLKKLKKARERGKGEKKRGMEKGIGRKREMYKQPDRLPGSQPALLMDELMAQLSKPTNY